jgi:putative heme-binding domain-containing protein
MRYSRPVNLRVAFLLACGVAHAQTTDNPLARDPQVVTAGYAVFRIYCSPCHGIHAQGGRGPDLTRGIYHSGDRDSDLFRTISDGLSGTEMVGFGSDMGDTDIWRVVAYVRSVANHEAAGVPGNGANGEKLFWEKGGCGACHAVQGRGGRMGPSLTRIGRQRSLEYLRNAVVDPNKDLLPGWATITVIKLDGTKLSGVDRGLDNFSVQLMDLEGNYYSFFRTDVASIKREDRSLMPADYGQRLKPAEIDDLVAYLAALRGTEASH